MAVSLIPLIYGAVNLEKPINYCINGHDCWVNNLIVENLTVNNMVTINQTDLNITGNLNLTGCIYFSNGFYSCGNTNKFDHVNFAYLTSNYGGSIDATGDPWYLSGTDFQIAEDLIVDGDLTTGNILAGNITFINQNQSINDISVKNLMDQSVGGILTGLFQFHNGVIIKKENLALSVQDVTGVPTFLVYTQWKKALVDGYLNVTENVSVGNSIQLGNNTIYSWDDVNMSGGNDGIWTNVTGTATFEGHVNVSENEWGIWSNSTCIVIGNTSMRSHC